jgi:hypothetical protein
MKMIGKTTRNLEEHLLGCEGTNAIPRKHCGPAFYEDGVVDLAS